MTGEVRRDLPAASPLPAGRAGWLLFPPPPLLQHTSFHEVLAKAVEWKKISRSGWLENHHRPLGPHRQWEPNPAGRGEGGHGHGDRGCSSLHEHPHGRRRWALPPFLNADRRDSAVLRDSMKLI